MESIKKPLAGLFALLFATSAVAALLFFNFERRGFTAETYQKAFAKDDFYNKLPAVLAEAMTSTDQSQFPLTLRGMDMQAWDSFFRTILKPEALKTMSDDLLNSTFAYLNLQTDSVQLALIPLKTGMVSDSGVQAVYGILATQPDCSLFDIAQMSLNLLTGGEMQFCNPPAELYPLLTPAIQGQLQLTAQIIPDQIVLLQAPPQNDPRQRLQTARLFMRLSPVLPLAFLLLMTLLAVDSLKSWLNWWGASFFAIGISAGLMGLSGAPVFSTIFQRFLIFRLPDYLPTVFLSYASDLASAMLQALLTPILWQGLSITFIGLLMIFAAYFIKSDQVSHFTKAG